MSTKQRPLKELLIALQTQGDLLDMLASSALSSDGFLRYRRQQNLLQLRTREQLLLANNESAQPPVLASASPTTEAEPKATMLSLGKPPRKRANRRPRRPTTPRSKTTSEQLPTATKSGHSASENDPVVQHVDFEDMVVGLPMSSAQSELHNDSSSSEQGVSATQNIDSLILDWAIDPTAATNIRLCQLRLQLARKHATEHRWSEALSEAHHAYELQPKNIEVVEACLQIAEQAALAQQIEYFLQKQAELHSS